MYYTAYGYLHCLTQLRSVLGFNGQIQSGPFYLLGNGHRGYEAALMRFISPDHLSPFGQGGLNSYAYCENDPVNLVDPSGRGPVPKFESPPRLPVAWLVRPNPPTVQPPLLVREPSTYPLPYQRLKAEDQKRHKATLDRSAMVKDRMGRHYDRLAHNGFAKNDGVLSITPAQRAELRQYEFSKQRLIGLSVKDSQALRGTVLDSLVTVEPIRLENGYYVEQIRIFLNRLPNADTITYAQLNGARTNIASAIKRVRKTGT